MHAKLEWRFVKEPVTETILLDLEKHLKVSLPRAYRQLVKEVNGGRPSRKVVALSDGRELVVKSFLNMDPAAKGGVLDVKGWLKDILPDNVVPFANDPFGNYFCFKYKRLTRKAELKVYYWNHENRELSFVADSFEGFLGKLKR